MRYKKAEVESAIDTVKGCKGDKIIACVKHVSSSGMSRHIEFACIHNGQLYNMTYFMAEILGYKYNDSDNSITVRGCGMDMIFNTLYCLNGNIMAYDKEHGLYKNGRDHDHYDYIFDSNHYDCM